MSSSFVSLPANPYIHDKYEEKADISNGGAEIKQSQFEPEDKDVESIKSDGRGNWGNQLDFLLSCMGYAIGLGNVWRFPYLCYENGGGAFLLVYCLLLVVAALPIMVLEMVFGQFTSTGAISAWTVSPLFKGTVLDMEWFCYQRISACNNIIIAYTIYYMIASCKNPLPWAGCDHDWNTENCYTDQVSDTTGATPTLASNVTVASGLGGKVWATEEYWKYHVLDITEGLHDMGTIRWEIFGCFLAAWLIVYLCIVKGIKTSGKVVYFTATFPFVVLIILLIRGATLDGAKEGILYFIQPKFELLASAQRLFITCMLWCIHKYPVRICSIFGLGFMSKDAGVPIEDVVQAGPGLTFVAYPEALSRLPLPQLWSFIFFFMLLTLGLDSQFVTLETVITAAVDEIKRTFPAISKYRFWVILGTCIFLSIAGLPLCYQGGIYLQTLLDWYPAGYSPMIMGLSEILVISYVYGYSNFRKDIHCMLGYYPGIYWVICWLGLTPGLLICVLLATFIDYTPASFGDYIYPPWAQAIGWFLVFTSVACIIFYAIYNLAHLQEGSFVERWKAATTPAREWGPALDEHRIEAGYEPLNTPKDDMELNVAYDNIAMDSKETQTPM
ncbi:putative sodium- and chloride-dependent glycine transporter 2-like [Apostichopus japonicus]|uniref:Transporter n=1 Tax=Stichopus japonicus TaxID=307972 RepID=A0A2G8KTG5_STIJA|nr:putative sodium- and chloride-dependent glycine transporter 2-like [Apostichopus japonicus]